MWIRHHTRSEKEKENPLEKDLLLNQMCCSHLEKVRNFGHCLVGLRPLASGNEVTYGWEEIPLIARPQTRPENDVFELCTVGYSTAVLQI